MKISHLFTILAGFLSFIEKNSTIVGAKIRNSNKKSRKIARHVHRQNPLI